MKEQPIIELPATETAALPVAVVAPNPLDLEPAMFASGLERRKANRALLMDWIRSALVEGTDYGSIPTKRGPSKPSLWKPGAEKICGMLNVTVTFPTLSDYEAAALDGKKLESLIIRCELIGPGGAVVASGVGSRSVSQDYGDLNKALKMACKSAHIDATLRMGGLSEVFTQDLENDPPKTPQDAPRPAKPQTSDQASKPAPTTKSATAGTATAKTDEKGWERYLDNCKAHLLDLIPADDEWIWWRYAVDNAWILTTESLADSSPAEMFKGYDRKNAKESVAAIVQTHMTKVKAMAANCSVEMHDEIRRGMVLLPRRDNPPEPVEPKNQQFCPVCHSTALKKHDDLIGVTWCQKCGTQWQDGSSVAYEEHEWMFAKMPFAPKDPEKKAYKGMTLGQIARLDSKYWFGIVMNFKAEPFKGRPPSAESVKFGEACEQARQHLEEGKERGHEEDTDDDNVPF